MFLRALCIVALIPMVACSEQGFTPVDEAKLTPNPDIEVAPEILDFGVVASGEQILRSFTVSNQGETALHVTDLELVSAGPFTILTPESDFEFLLDPSGVREFEVVFEPTQAVDATGQITVFSDDWDEPQSIVQLTAFAAVPELVITPDVYDFGDSPIPCEEEVELTLSNIGLEPLVIDSLDYTSSTGEMALVDSNAWPITLGTNEEVAVAVTFAPTITGPSDGVLEVTSTDPRGVVQGEQSGNGAYDLEVDDQFVVPDETVDIYQSPSRVTEDFTSPKYKTDNFTASSDATDTFTAPEYQTETFASPQLSMDSFTAPQGVLDAFVVPDEPPVDIIFAVDQSCSMDSISNQLASGFSQFITEINNVTSGWHIGVVTNDDGCFNHGILNEFTGSSTATTADDYEALFTDAVTQGGCSGGYPSCKTESLLELTKIALDETATGGCNAGFLRPGAMLHVITVTDEEENSYKDSSSYTWSYWLWEFTNFVSDPALIKVSGIVDYTVSCGDGTGADGYEEAVNYTGGELLDVCNSSWALNTQALAVASLTAIDEYLLTQAAEESTVQVFVDGVEWTTGWHFDSTSNSVVFDVPLSGGEDLEITYLPAGSLLSFVLSDTPDSNSITVYVNGVEWTSDWAYDSTTNSVVFLVPMENGEAIDVEYVPAASATDYLLSDTPDPSTISVQVNGGASSNWSYDSTDNSITFTGSLPAAALIEVSYLSASAVMTYPLSDIPNSGSILVSVNGVVWGSDWQYDVSSNSVSFDIEVADGETIEITYEVLSTIGEFILSKTPVVSTITVTVDGSVWSSNWQYESTTNGIEFLVDLPSAASVSVNYLSASASSTYTLSDLPDEDTVMVYIDGTMTPSGWTYDAASNAVIFSIPLTSKALVQVEYIKLSDLVVYQLSGNPLISSIEVRVDGQTWSSNWSYDAVSNTVSFSQSLSDGAIVEIEYIDATTNIWYLLSDFPDESSLKVRVDGVLWTSDWEYKSNVNGLKFLVNLSPGSLVEARYGVFSECP
jgi:hypothetical protein